MKRWIRHIVITSFLALSLSACGERAPAGWNANLDVSCQPQDPYDKLYATLSPEKFWREQEYDLGTMAAAGQKNLEMSKTVLNDSRSQKGEYLSRAQEAASKLGLSGKDAREHVKENVDRFEREVNAIEERIKMQETANQWVHKCQREVVNELRKLGIAPTKYDPEKRPM